MIEQINAQDEITQNAIYRAPIFMTLFAANQDGVLRDKEIEAAVDFLKVETYNGPEFMQDFFKKVEIDFKEKVVEWNLELPLGKPNRDRKLIDLMQPVRNFIAQMDPEHAVVFKRELTEFILRIESSNKSILESAILPLFSGFLHSKTKTSSKDIL